MMAWAPSLCVAQAHAELDIGGVRARFYSNGRVSADTVITGPQFEVPVGEANALYAGGLWIAGQTSLNQTRVSRTLFDSGGTIQFFPGPLRADGTASTDQQTSALYDRVWKVSREQVATHLAYYNCLSDPACDINVEFPLGYTIPADIAEWPAMGNSMDGYAVFLAPFYDYNLDGNYVAAEGDAPCIIGDQALFSVFSDRLSTQFGNEPLGVEVHQMPFAYATGDPMLDQTVFIRYHLINRSTETYTNTMLGFFNDFDLGCSNDDFIGCDPSRNLAYVYNWDDVDENCLGATGYQEQPPAFGMQLLKGPLMDATGLDEPVSNYLPNWNGQGFGDDIPDNERNGMSHFLYFNREGPNWAITYPAVPQHHYNYLRGIWKDGTPMTYGGNGYSNDPEAVESAYMFPGADDPVGAGTGGQVMPPWAEDGPTPATPDRSGVMSSGPITLEPGEHVDLLLAYVYARASSGGAMASVTALQQRADSVAAFAQTLPVWNIMEELGFNGQCADYLTLGVDEVPGMWQLILAPSPASDIVHFMAARELVGGLLTVRDATGRVVLQQRVVPDRNAIDVSRLPPGLYTCDVLSRSARLSGRLIKE